MAKFLKLTDQFGNGIELANAEDITAVYPDECTIEVEKTETVKGFFGGEKQVTYTEEEDKKGSKVLFKNGEYTYVAESPEEIFGMLEGA